MTVTNRATGTHPLVHCSLQWVPEWEILVHVLYSKTQLTLGAVG